MSLTSFAVTAFCLLTVVYSAGEVSKKTEKDLYRHLFENQNYDKRFRPVKNPKNAVPVTVSITPLTFTYGGSDIYVLSTWVSMKWKDEYLQWNLDHFEGINKIPVSASDVWTPDLFIFSNQLDASPLINVTKSTSVTYDGEVTLISHNYIPLLYESGSNPYALSIISMTYSNPEIDIGAHGTEEEFNFEGQLLLKNESLAYYKSSSYRMESVEVLKDRIHFNWNQKPYPVVKFLLKFN